MGLFGAIGLIALVLAAALRNRVHFVHHRETFLLTGSALAMLLGSTATSEFIVRYLIPTVPLLTCGGILALMDLARAVRR